jgi:hydrogenase maturation protease
MLSEPVFPSRHRFVEPWVAPSTADTDRALASACQPLVLAFGNVLLRDDGAGVRLMARLRAESADASVQYIDGGTMSFSLLPYIEATGALLVIDAADLCAAPGGLRLLEGAQMDAFLQGGRRRTVHEVGIVDLLDMARLRGCLPQRRALLCLQPDCIAWGEALSPAVQEALPEAATVARGLLRRWAGA